MRLCAGSGRMQLSFGVGCGTSGAVQTPFFVPLPQTAKAVRAAFHPTPVGVDARSLVDGMQRHYTGQLKIAVKDVRLSASSCLHHWCIVSCGALLTRTTLKTLTLDK